MKRFKALVVLASLLVSAQAGAMYFDIESGLDANGFREYRPPDGRYTQNDPIGLHGGWNRRTIDENNPLLFTDPMGLDPWAGSSANYRYTPIAGSPVDGPTSLALTCFSICAGGTGPGVTITAGKEGGHSKGSAHEVGQACDIGKNSNPGLTRTTTEQCFNQCFPAGRSWGQEEGNHFHLQTRAGRNGGTGFIQGVH